MKGSSVCGSDLDRNYTQGANEAGSTELSMTPVAGANMDQMVDACSTLLEYPLNSENPAKNGRQSTFPKPRVPFHGSCSPCHVPIANPLALEKYFRRIKMGFPVNFPTPFMLWSSLLFAPTASALTPHHARGFQDSSWIEALWNTQKDILSVSPLYQFPKKKHNI